MNSVFSVMLIIILLLKNSSGNEGANQYQLSIAHNYQLCDPGSQSYEINGNMIFQNSDASQTTVTSIGISGWFFLRGYLNIEYNMVTVIENGIVLFKVQYNQFSKQYTADLLSVQGTPVVSSTPGGSLVKNQWFFMKCKMEYDSQMNEVTFQILILELNNQYTASIEDVSTHNYSFQKNLISVNLGNPSSIVSPSCSYTQQVYMYWDTDLISLFTLKNDIVAYNTKLEWNYDLFYSEKNPGYAIGVLEPNHRLPISIIRPEQFVLKEDEIFLTDYINSSEQQGFTLSFHVKLNFPPNIQRLLTFKSTTELICLNIDNGQLHLNLISVVSIQQNKWYQITLVVKLIFNSQVIIIVNDDPSSIQTLYFSSYFEQIQIQFGDQLNSSVSIYLNHIRLYYGSFLSETTDCFLQASREIKSCIICKSPYIIDYQNNFAQCVSISPINQSTQIDNVRDWYPMKFKCHPDMILDFKTSSCICRFGFYREGDLCFKCQNYCKGCLDKYTCITQDSNRNQQGECKEGLFDDGYACINPKFIIRSKTNLLLQVPIIDCNYLSPGDPDFDFDQSELNLQPNSEFLFSFSFKSEYQDPELYTIGKLTDGSTEVFSIILESKLNSPTSENFYFVILYALGNEIHKFMIYQQEYSWLGVWTDFNIVIFFVQTNGQFLSSGEISVDFSSYTLNSPVLCIGLCDSLISFLIPCAQYGPIQIIQKVIKPLDTYQIQTLLSNYQLVFTNTLGLATFTLNFFNIPTNNEIIDPSTNKLLKILPTTIGVIEMDRFRGIQFTESVYGNIYGLNVDGDIPTFSCSIFIEKLTFQTQILSGDMGQTNVEYYIVPYGERAFIRVCMFNACNDTKYAMLNMNEQNYLHIIFRRRSQYAIDDFVQIELEVICNYQREYIRYVSSQSTSITSPLILEIVNQVSTRQAGEYIIYMNNIQFDNGNGSYYIDETSEERCYIFRNVYNMECSFPKKGFYFYKQFLITEEECHQQTQLNQSLHLINSSTSQCVDTLLPPLCIEIYNNLQTVQCKKCKYENANILDNCQCPVGSFLNKETNQCLKCSERCLSCYGSFNNCLTCKFFDQNPPFCDCQLRNYFLDQYFVCQECLYKCDTCQQYREYCITCSTNRVNPPYCECDDSFQEINNQCYKLQCDNKCQSCSIATSNCLICKSGRVNPPLCMCDTNYYENLLDGTCTQCPSGNYYDQLNKICSPCRKPCKECVKSQNFCTSCQQGLILKKESCFCENGNSAYFLSDNEFICLEDMDVSLKFILQQTFYQLELNFDYNLKELSNQDQEKIQKLIQISFSEISPSNYYLSNPSIRENKLLIKLNIINNFNSVSGKLQFLDNTRFVSSSQRYILSAKYKTHPISFEIGPFLFEESILNQGKVDDIIHYLKYENTQLVQIIQQFQLVLYFLNTAQPILLYLLLKAQLPPNLYKFYQMIGLTIFPTVADYQTLQYKENFELFKHDLNQTEAYKSQNTVFQKIGFSNSFLINAQGIILKYSLIIIIICVIHFILIYHKYNLKQIKLIEKMASLYKKIIQMLNSENDTNLLLTTLSILCQTAFEEQTIWIIRYGYYLACAFIIFKIVSFAMNFYEVNFLKKYHEGQYSFQFIERLRKRKHVFISRNFFLIQLLKKYILILILFMLQNLPTLSCIINGAILILSGFLTVNLQPFKNSLSRIIKIIGEFSISIVWLLHMVLIKIEDQLNKQIILNEELVNIYIGIGYVIIIILLFFNFLYIIDFFQTIFLKIYHQIKSKKYTNQNPRRIINAQIFIPYSNFKKRDKVDHHLFKNQLKKQPQKGILKQKSTFQVKNNNK